MKIITFIYILVDFNIVCRMLIIKLSSNYKITNRINYKKQNCILIVIIISKLTAILLLKIKNLDIGKNRLSTIDFVFKVVYKVIITYTWLYYSLYDDNNQLVVPIKILHYSIITCDKITLESLEPISFFFSVTNTPEYTCFYKQRIYTIKDTFAFPVLLISGVWVI